MGEMYVGGGLVIVEDSWNVIGNLKRLLFRRSISI